MGQNVIAAVCMPYSVIKEYEGQSVLRRTALSGGTGTLWSVFWGLRGAIRVKEYWVIRVNKGKVSSGKIICRVLTMRESGIRVKKQNVMRVMMVERD